MATIKAINLRVRPYVSVDLAFPVDGVITHQTSLGASVGDITVTALYSMLGQTVEDDPSRLLWDSQQIYSYLRDGGIEGSRCILAKLRNASEAADLDRAVMLRQNAYLTSYSPYVLKEMQDVYSGGPGGDSLVSRHQLMSSVEDDITRMHQGLTDAYTRRGWLGKVIEYTYSTNDNSATQYVGSQQTYFDGITKNKSQGYEFRFPSAENDLRYHQALAAVRQEKFNAWRTQEMCRNGDITFPNELGAIDLSIRKLQSAYIDTFLTTPDFGIVTGVFHGAGDYVRAGEPVIRVESDSQVYLVGTVKYRGMLRIGIKLEVSTTLFEAVGDAPITVSGEVVAVRGHDSVSEQWEVLILCLNHYPGGSPHEYESILPLNYNFDFESTTIEVVP